MAYTTFDLDDLKAKMEARWDNVPFWDDTEAKNAINEALIMWNTLTGFWKRRVTVPTVIGQQDYELPATMVFGMRVEYSGATLTPTSKDEMDEGRPGWQGETGTPKRWMPLDLNTIRLWPAPTAVANLTIDGVSATPQLTYDGETVDIGSEALSALIGYSLHSVALKEGGARFQATMPLFQAFLDAAAQENKQLLLSATFRHFMGIVEPKLHKTR
jgi:hypothetical protein